MKDDIYNIEHYSPGPDGARIGLWVNACGHFVTADHILRNRIRNDFLLVYCIQGSGTYTVGERTFNIAQGDIYATLPNLPHSYQCDLNGWDIWFTHFGGDQAERLMEWIGFSPAHLVMDIGIQPSFIQIFQKLYRQSQDKSLDYEISSSSLLFELLLSLKKNTRIKAVKQSGLVEALKGNPDNIDTMAAQAGMSKYHFIREFKKSIGITPWRFITMQRITKAKELLTQNDLLVKEIAFRLGFSDPNYFSRLFHKETGVSAEEFRRNLMR